MIAHAWDATFALVDGAPTPDDLKRLSSNVPKQEAGRITGREICLSRANRSVRLFEHVVARLAQGRQPDLEMVDTVGYAMRTTAVYGSGKFGAADRESLAVRPELAGPFQAEMLTVYLIRAFVLDLVEHMAQARAPGTAVEIEPGLRRRFGVGNSTGLGLAPFLVNHPILLNNWITAREEALARVRDLDRADTAAVVRFREVPSGARANAEAWRSQLEADLARLERRVATGALDRAAPWDRLCRWAEPNLSLEGQEQLVSLMLAPYGALVDDLADTMAADESAALRIDGAMSLDRLREIVGSVHGWALKLDWSAPDSSARAWYVSAEKIEPRLGERHEEPIEAYERPLAPGRDAAAMQRDLDAWEGEPSVAAFLLAHPEHRYMARRAQITARFPYAEVRDNTISAALLPIDLLRCKLAFFGATHFDPRSDRWVRINMFKDAPFPHELAQSDAEDWACLARETAAC